MSSEAPASLGAAAERLRARIAARQEQERRKALGLEDAPSAVATQDAPVVQTSGTAEERLQRLIGPTDTKAEVAAATVVEATESRDGTADATEVIFVEASKQDASNSYSGPEVSQPHVVRTDIWRPAPRIFQAHWNGKVVWSSLVSSWPVYAASSALTFLLLVGNSDTTAVRCDILGVAIGLFLWMIFGIYAVYFGLCREAIWFLLKANTACFLYFGFIVIVPGLLIQVLTVGAVASFMPACCSFILWCCQQGFEDLKLSDYPILVRLGTVPHCRVFVVSVFFLSLSYVALCLSGYSICEERMALFCLSGIPLSIISWTAALLFDLRSKHFSERNSQQKLSSCSSPDDNPSSSALDTENVYERDSCPKQDIQLNDSDAQPCAASGLADSLTDDATQSQTVSYVVPVALNIPVEAGVSHCEDVASKPASPLSVEEGAGVGVGFPFPRGPTRPRPKRRVSTVRSNNELVFRTVVEETAEEVMKHETEGASSPEAWIDEVSEAVVGASPEAHTSQMIVEDVDLAHLSDLLVTTEQQKVDCSAFGGEKKDIISAAYSTLESATTTAAASETLSSLGPEQSGQEDDSPSLKETLSETEDVGRARWSSCAFVQCHLGLELVHFVKALSLSLLGHLVSSAFVAIVPYSLLSLLALAVTKLVLWLSARIGSAPQHTSGSQECHDGSLSFASTVQGGPELQRNYVPGARQRGSRRHLQGSKIRQVGASPLGRQRGSVNAVYPRCWGTDDAVTPSTSRGGRRVMFPGAALEGSQTASATATDEAEASDLGRPMGRRGARPALEETVFPGSVPESDTTAIFVQSAGGWQEETAYPGNCTTTTLFPSSSQHQAQPLNGQNEAGGNVEGTPENAWPNLPMDDRGGKVPQSGLVLPEEPSGRSWRPSGRRGARLHGVPFGSEAESTARPSFDAQDRRLIAEAEHDLMWHPKDDFGVDMLKAPPSARISEEDSDHLHEWNVARGLKPQGAYEVLSCWQRSTGSKLRVPTLRRWKSVVSFTHSGSRRFVHRSFFRRIRDLVTPSIVLFIGLLHASLSFGIFILDIVFIEKYVSSSFSKRYALAGVDATCLYSKRGRPILYDVRDPADCARLLHFSSDAHAFSIGPAPVDHGPGIACYLEDFSVSQTSFEALLHGDTSGVCNFSEAKQFNFFVIEPRRGCARADVAGSFHGPVVYASSRDLSQAIGSFLGSGVGRFIASLITIARHALDVDVAAAMTGRAECFGLYRFAASCMILGAFVTAFAVVSMDIFSMLAVGQELAVVRATSYEGNTVAGFFFITGSTRLLTQALLLVLQILIASGSSFQTELLALFDEDCSVWSSYSRLTARQERSAGSECPDIWRRGVDCVGMALIFVTTGLAFVLGLSLLAGVIYHQGPVGAVAAPLSRWALSIGRLTKELLLTRFTAPHVSNSSYSKLAMPEVCCIRVPLQTACLTFVLRPILGIAATFGMWHQLSAIAFQIGRRQDLYQPTPQLTLRGADHYPRKFANVELVSWRSILKATSDSLSLAWLLVPYGALPARACSYLNERVVVALGVDGGQSVDEPDSLSNHLFEDSNRSTYRIHWALSVAQLLVMQFIVWFDAFQLRADDRRTVLAVLLLAAVILCLLGTAADMLQRISSFRRRRDIMRACQALVEEKIPARLLQEDDVEVSDEDLFAGLHGDNEVLAACLELQELEWVREGILPIELRHRLVAARIARSPRARLASTVLQAWRSQRERLTEGLPKLDDWRNIVRTGLVRGALILLLREAVREELVARRCAAAARKLAARRLREEAIGQARELQFWVEKEAKSQATSWAQFLANSCYLQRALCNAQEVPNGFGQKRWPDDPDKEQEDDEECQDEPRPEEPKSPTTATVTEVAQTKEVDEQQPTDQGGIQIPDSEHHAEVAASPPEEPTKVIVRAASGVTLECSTVSSFCKQFADTASIEAKKVAAAASLRVPPWTSETTTMRRTRMLFVASQRGVCSVSGHWRSGGRELVPKFDVEVTVTVRAEAVVYFSPTSSVVPLDIQLQVISHEIQPPLREEAGAITADRKQSDQAQDNPWSLHCSLEWTAGSPRHASAEANIFELNSNIGQVKWNPTSFLPQALNEHAFSSSMLYDPCADFEKSLCEDSKLPSLAQSSLREAVTAATLQPKASIKALEVALLHNPQQLSDAFLAALYVGAGNLSPGDASRRSWLLAAAARRLTERRSSDENDSDWEGPASWQSETVRLAWGCPRIDKSQRPRTAAICKRRWLRPSERAALERRVSSEKVPGSAQGSRSVAGVTASAWGLDNVSINQREKTPEPPVPKVNSVAMEKGGGKLFILQCEDDRTDVGDALGQDEATVPSMDADDGNTETAVVKISEISGEDRAGSSSSDSSGNSNVKTLRRHRSSVSSNDSQSSGGPHRSRHAEPVHSTPPSSELAAEVANPQLLSIPVIITEVDAGSEGTKSPELMSPVNNRVCHALPASSLPAFSNISKDSALTRLQAAVGRARPDLDELTLALDAAKKAFVEPAELEGAQAKVDHLNAIQQAALCLLEAMLSANIRQLESRITMAREVGMAPGDLPDDGGTGVLQRAAAVLERQKSVAEGQLQAAFDDVIGIVAFQRAIDQARAAKIPDKDLLYRAEAKMHQLSDRKREIALLKAAINAENAWLLKAATEECRQQFGGAAGVDLTFAKSYILEVIEADALPLPAAEMDDDGNELTAAVDPAKKDRLTRFRQYISTSGLWHKIQNLRKPRVTGDGGEASPRSVDEGKSCVHPVNSCLSRCDLASPDPERQRNESRAVEALRVAMFQEPLHAELLRLAITRARRAGAQGAELSQAEELWQAQREVEQAFEQLRRASAARDVRTLRRSIEDCCDAGLDQRKLLFAFLQLGEALTELLQMARTHGLAMAVLADVERERHDLHFASQEARTGLRTICRIRPSLPHELHSALRRNAGLAPALSRVDRRTLGLGGPTENYVFNSVLGPESTQEEVFSELQGLAQAAVDGSNVTIMSCGPVGAGKTFTLHGKSEQGIVPRLVEELFAIKSRDAWRSQLFIDVQALAIKDECHVVDLLASNPEDSSLPFFPTHGCDDVGPETARSILTPSRICIEGAATRRVADQQELLDLALQVWPQPAMTATTIPHRHSSSGRDVMLNVCLTRANRTTGVSTTSRLVIAELADASAYEVVGHAISVLSGRTMHTGGIQRGRQRTHLLSSFLEGPLGSLRGHCGSLRAVLILNFAPNVSDRDDVLATLEALQLRQRSQTTAIQNSLQRTYPPRHVSLISSGSMLINRTFGHSSSPTAEALQADNGQLQEEDL